MPETAAPRQHFLISNKAFRQMTGIRWICFVCGAPDPAKKSVCPGKRPDREAEA